MSRLHPRTLALLGVILSPEGADAWRNMCEDYARGQRTFLSTTAHGGPSCRGVDGMYNTHFHTVKAYNQWWAVDITKTGKKDCQYNIDDPSKMHWRCRHREPEERKKVRLVRMLNRQDCCCESHDV